MVLFFRWDMTRQDRMRLANRATGDCLIGTSEYQMGQILRSPYEALEEFELSGKLPLLEPSSAQQVTEPEEVSRA